MPDVIEKPTQIVENARQRPVKLIAGIALVVVVLVVIIVAVISHGSKKAAVVSRGKNGTQNSSSQSSNSTQGGAQGTAIVLGAGTFTVGADIPAGVYDVTAPAGQSGNFIVRGTSATAAYNEFIGNPSYGDVSKIRVVLTAGEKVQISDMSNVSFAPVAARSVTAHATANLYAGTFVVGQDIGPGKYVATPASGESGNLFVDASDHTSKVSKILGSDTSAGDVPSCTVTLNAGDVVTLSGIDSVEFRAE